MESKGLMLIRGKTHAWFNAQRTIVHWHLKHGALPIEQLFV